MCGKLYARLLPVIFVLTIVLPACGTAAPVAATETPPPTAIPPTATVTATPTSTPRPTATVDLVRTQQVSDFQTLV